MNPKIQYTSESNDILRFTLSGCDVSLANAIRRTILSDITQLVFKTSGLDQTNVSILTNTTNLNNEILKQRLSCIPIHTTPGQPLYDNYSDYIMELNVENTTDTILVVTTEDFVIRNKSTNELITNTHEIFPPNVLTNSFIDLVRLKPQLSDELTGEKIQLSALFSLGTAKEDGMFNVASTISYGFTVDAQTNKTALVQKQLDWKNEGKTDEMIEFETKNWQLLDGMRFTLLNSFDFIIETVGVYTNQQLFTKACDVLVENLTKLLNITTTDKLDIKESNSTMNNCFDIILHNQDYTIGKVLEYFIYSTLYHENVVSFCGFKLMHPHDEFGILRVAYTKNIDRDNIHSNLSDIIQYAIVFFTRTRDRFLEETN
tara:strand:- start:13755 stop:14873 length:1119 start_codon:yes stop_codon:yes gene_type:complete